RSSLGLGLPDCELLELGQRHLVALDADDSARRTLGRSLAELVRLFLARAQRLVALPEGDQLGAAALAVDQRDEALEAAELADLRNDLLLRVARPFVEALRRAFEGTHARRAGPLASLRQHDLVDVDGRPPSALRLRDLVSHALELRLVRAGESRFRSRTRAGIEDGPPWFRVSRR